VAEESILPLAPCSRSRVYAHHLSFLRQSCYTLMALPLHSGLPSFLHLLTGITHSLLLKSHVYVPRELSPLPHPHFFFADVLAPFLLVLFPVKFKTPISQDPSHDQRGFNFLERHFRFCSQVLPFFMFRPNLVLFFCVGCFLF